MIYYFYSVFTDLNNFDKKKNNDVESVETSLRRTRLVRHNF